MPRLRLHAAAPCSTGNQPRWVRPSAALLLAFSAVLYLWNLEATGYANSFYAAAVQAGTKDWMALLFGSLDAGNAITVDKPPASLWIPGLAGADLRLLGARACSFRRRSWEWPPSDFCT